MTQKKENDIQVKIDQYAVVNKQIEKLKVIKEQLRKEIWAEAHPAAKNSGTVQRIYVTKSGKGMVQFKKEKKTKINSQALKKNFKSVFNNVKEEQNVETMYITKINI